MEILQDHPAPMKYAILRAGRELFTQKGFDNTTVQELAELLHIETRIFYDHFHSLDELLETIWAE